MLKNIFFLIWNGLIQGFYLNKKKTFLILEVQILIKNYFKMAKWGEGDPRW